MQPQSSRACNAQDMNALYLAASADRQFLAKALQPVLASDEFTRRQFQMYESLMDEHAGNTHRRQTVTLQIQRSDYMLDDCKDGARLKQASYDCSCTEIIVSPIIDYLRSR